MTPFILNDFSSTASSSMNRGENEQIRYIPIFVPIQGPQEILRADLIDFRCETPPARNSEGPSLIFPPQLPSFGSAQLVSPFLSLSLLEPQEFQIGNANESDLASAMGCPSLEPETCSSDWPSNLTDHGKENENGSNATCIQGQEGEDFLSMPEEKIDEMTRLEEEVEKSDDVREVEKPIDETVLI